MENKIILKNAKKMRYLAGLSSKEAAEKLNITRQALSTYETGRNTPTVKRLNQMAELYKCSVADLF